jgi:hypothetical protein
LIHWLLLSYLPLWGMRNSPWTAFGAGCGQLFVTTRSAYQRAGGHEAIKDSMHDGIALPRAYRRAGLHTDICDATDLAACRMYRSAGEVWNGLAKNAHEGMGTPKAILIWTLLLLGGSVLPFSILTRLHGTRRLQQSWLGAVLHPVGIMILIAIQWYAFVRRLIGHPIGWKGRLSRKPHSHFALAHTSSSSTIA